MIDKLTEQQEAMFSHYVKKWIDIGLDTSAIDLGVIRGVIDRLYNQVGLVPPDRVEVYDSPFAAIIAMKEKYGVKVSANDFSYGSHDSEWLSFFDFFVEVVGVEKIENLEAVIDFAKNCGWVLFYDELAVLTEKPISIKMDDRNRTHCEDDYAIKYRDGTGVAVWHGTRIPSNWIFDRDSISSDVFLRWENIEQRRCACELVGWEKVIRHLDPIELDRDEDPTIGTLYEVDLPDAGKEKFLVALDPNRDSLIGLPVPPEMKTALESNSWTYGIDKVEFVPDFRV